MLVLLGTRFDVGYVWITLGALVLYGTYTITITEWRTKYRKAMNEADSRANTKAIDALINFETVKYFNNERFESERPESERPRPPERSRGVRSAFGAGGAGSTIRPVKR